VSASIHTLPVTLGDLTLVERLGAGGMAEVFLATRPSPLGGVEKVVVKRMLPHLASQDGYRRLFRREAAIGARIVDRHVVRTDSLVEDDDGLMLVVEFIDGATLRTLARAAYDRQSTLPLPVVLRLFVHAAAGLAAIHATTDEQGRPFVHRDISPDNLMVGRDGVTRVLDFGVARPGGEGVLTRTGEIRGKLPYMPPEQLDARSLDGRADLYALGVSLFWMLTGRRPFVHRSEVQLIRAIMQQRPPRVRSLAPDVPPDLDGLIDELLAKDPARRPRDALGVARRLENMGAADEADVAAFVEEFLALEPVTTRARRLQSQASTSVGRRDAASARGSLDGSPGADALGARVSTRAPTLSAASEWGGDDGHEGGHDDGPGDGPEDVHDDGDPAPPPPAPITATSATRAPRAPNADTPRRAALVGLVAGALVALGLGAVGLAVSLAPATDSGALVPRLPAAPTPAAPTPAAPSPTPATAAGAAAQALASLTPTPPTMTPPTTTDDGGSTGASGGRGRPAAKATRVIAVAGAPAGTVWLAAGREVGRGDGPLSLPAGVDRVEASFDGARVSVVVEGGDIDWDALPRGVLSVRAHEGTVRVGAASWDVPAKVRLVAGRYVVRYVDDDGRSSEHRVEVRAGGTTVLNVAEAP